MAKRIALIIILIALFVQSMCGCTPKGDSPKMGYKDQQGMQELARWTIPDRLPGLLSGEGEEIFTVTEWEERRTELLEMLSLYVYGPRPGYSLLRFEEGEEDLDAAVASNALTRFVKLYYDEERFVSIRVTRPDGNGKYPVVMRFEADDEHRFPMEREYIAAEKYIFVAVNNTSAAPEDEEITKEYMHETKAIMAWACAASLAADYIEKQDFADSNKLAIAGMSRTGKAAICAGVYDARFGVIIANSSGAGGASGFRSYGQTGAQGIDLVMHQPTWVSDVLNHFREFPETLPFDMHCARALIAPRVILTTESADGPDSAWACPYSAFRMWEAADPVFELYGKKENNLIHLRPGEHLQLPEDYERMMQIINAVFWGEAFQVSEFRQNRLPAK